MFKEKIKKTFFGRILRRLRKIFSRWNLITFQLEKFDGNPLTPSLQNKIQLITKKNNAIYSLNEIAARDLADNWQGMVTQPKNLRFIEGAIPVVLCANNDFAPYMAVMLQSLLDKSNFQRKYHFIIFEHSFVNSTKDLLTKQASHFPHCSIDFVDTKNAFLGIPITPTSNHVSIDAFLRLFIPYWLDKYPKIIYCDSDMLAKADIAELYDIDIKNYCMGATVNKWILSSINKQKYSTWATFAVFTILDNWSCYINSGLLIFNTKVFKEKISYHELFKFAIYYTNRYKRRFNDQDVLSLSVKNDYFLLPPEWNYCWGISQASDPNAKIIHFISNIKPWKDIPEIANHPDAIAYRNYAESVPLYKNTLKAK